MSQDERGEGGIPTALGIAIMLFTALITVYVLGGLSGVATGHGFAEGGEWYLQHLSDPVTVPPGQWYIVTGEPPASGGGALDFLFQRPPENWTVQR